MRGWPPRMLQCVLADGEVGSQPEASGVARIRKQSLFPWPPPLAISIEHWSSHTRENTKGVSGEIRRTMSGPP